MQTLIGNNVTTKVNAAVSANRNSNGTAYTAPATGYAILTLRVPVAATLNIEIGGQSIYALTAQTVAPIVVYLGPNQTVVVSGYTSGVIYITGVEFINSP